MAKLAQRTKLSRQRDQRRAMFKSLAESMIIHESIETTSVKAKALKPYIEKLVTKAKVDNQHSRKQVKSRLHTNESLNKLFNDIAPRYTDRPGGYTRIERTKWRRGDDAEMARISFVPAKEAEKTENNAAATEEKPKAAAKPANEKKTASKSSNTTKTESDS